MVRWFFLIPPVVVTCAYTKLVRNRREREGRGIRLAKAGQVGESDGVTKSGRSSSGGNLSKGRGREGKALPPHRQRVVDRETCDDARAVKMASNSEQGLLVHVAEAQAKGMYA